jgi:hypothetical protein
LVFHDLHAAREDEVELARNLVALDYVLAWHHVRNIQAQQHGVDELRLGPRERALRAATLVDEFDVVGVGHLDLQRARQVEVRQHQVLSVFAILQGILGDDAEILRCQFYSELNNRVSFPGH